jgi:hypothetical protein
MASEFVLTWTVVAVSLTPANRAGSGNHAGGITEPAPAAGEMEGRAPAGSAEVFGGEDGIDVHARLVQLVTRVNGSTAEGVGQ